MEGKIENADISGDFFSVGDIKEFASTLDGVKFTKNDVAAAFQPISGYIKGANADEIIDKLFS